MCHVFAVPFDIQIHRENHIYYRVQDPAEGNIESNVLCSFDFQKHTTGVTGTDGDGLKYTQETGGANGHVPAKSLNIQKNFTTKITDEPLHPKRVYCH